MPAPHSSTHDESQQSLDAADELRWEQEQALEKAR